PVEFFILSYTTLFRSIILMIIATITACVSFAVAMLPAHTPFWAMVPVTIIFGFCVSGFNGIWMNVATELVPREQAGAASGFSIIDRKSTRLNSSHVKI